MERLWIKVIGNISEDLKVNFFKALDSENLKKNELILFCTYSDFDIPIGHCFTHIKTDEDSEGINCRVVLKNVTQQFFLPLDEIPHGWKTVCKFEFIEGIIPKEVQQLPVLNGWTQSDSYLLFA
ncbi:hypothetical protein [Chitinophaga defluvii]|uniref:Immunity protein 50 of polymorphic toxin system n=1 Tax=Chitinophaga defluvii TaxID=3163343 RepID=A0ABV2T3Y3_9BACT